MRDINWEEIGQRLPKVADTRVQSSRLADMDFWLLKASAKVKKRDVAKDSASLLSASIRHLKDEWCELIAFAAAQEGISFEDMFIKLAMGEGSED